MNDAIRMFRVWFLKLVAMFLRIGESFWSDLIRSVRIVPTNRDAPPKAKLTMFVRTMGRFVCEDPRCGVPRKKIPLTESRMSLNDSSSTWAVISAYQSVSWKPNIKTPTTTFFTTIPPILWQRNIITRFRSYWILDKSCVMLESGITRELITKNMIPHLLFAAISMLLTAICYMHLYSQYPATKPLRLHSRRKRFEPRGDHLAESRGAIIFHLDQSKCQTRPQ